MVKNKLTYQAKMNPCIFVWSFFEVDPAAVVAPVGVVQRLDDEKGGDDLCSSFRSEKILFRLRSCTDRLVFFQITLIDQVSSIRYKRSMS